MLRKKGFTLVELLVVMAIIAILAAIAVPNISNYIARARMTRAQAEISGIETSLVKMLADSGRSSLSQLFRPGPGFTEPEGTPGMGRILELAAQGGLDPMAVAQDVYTSAVYALLREGRIALTDADPQLLIKYPPNIFSYQENGDNYDGSNGLKYGTILDRAAIAKLGTSYMDVRLDPWGNIYQIFAGPWNRKNNPILYRTYLRDAKEEALPGQKKNRSDGAEFAFVDPETDEQLTIGYSAGTDMVAYIFSFGQNMASGQMIYGGGYADGQDAKYTGGGDDINNWDKGSSWERFY